MTDRAWTEIKVLHCPDDQTVALREALVAQFEEDVDGFPCDFYIEEFSVGINDEAAALAQAAPGATFVLQQAPKYEFSGTLCLHVPEPYPATMPLAIRDCDGGGNIVVRAEVLREIMDTCTEHPAELLSRLDHELAGPWLRAIEGMNDTVLIDTITGLITDTSHLKAVTLPTHLQTRHTLYTDPGRAVQYAGEFGERWKPTIPTQPTRHFETCTECNTPVTHEFGMWLDAQGTAGCPGPTHATCTDECTWCHDHSPGHTVHNPAHGYDQPCTHMHSRHITLCGTCLHPTETSKQPGPTPSTKEQTNA